MVKNRLLKHIAHILILSCLVGILLGQAAAGSAQSDPEGWTAPVDLSGSGSASNPMLLIDANAVIHVVWQDKFAGFYHTVQTTKGWSAPGLLPSPWIPLEALSKPGRNALEAPVPLLVADQKGYIYAFWIDAASQLWTNRAPVKNFGAKGSWEASQMISAGVLDLDVTVDAANRLHLVYIYQNQTDTKQPGIYYLSRTDSTNSWTKEVLLVSDAYFRGISKDQSNLAIATGSTATSTTVYVAWDNRPLKRVFLAQSADGGKSWGQAKEIAGPGSGTGNSMPFNINVGASGSNAVIVWQAGQPANCKQYAVGSTNNGATWSERQLMLAGTPGCSQKNQFIVSAQNQIFLASTILDQVFLLAWDGNHWSEPQLQKELYGFINPNTFNTVNFKGFQFAFSKDNQLFSVAYDVTDVGDIWFTSRAVRSTASWFQPKSAWVAPVKVTNENDTQPVTGLTLVPDGENAVHALWIQPDPASQGVESIFYSRWDGTNWSNPTDMQHSPDGDVNEFSAALSEHGRLLVAWSGGPSGQVYYSWADASKAINVAEWTRPVALPSPQPAGSAPKILVETSGKVDVAYAIPVNEGRGIYLTSSVDEGQTWSDPVKVFDAVAAGWSQANTPEIYQESNGRLGIIWSQMTLQGSLPVALYSALSNDQGKTWSQAKKIADAKAVWFQAVTGNAGSVSLAWLEKSNEVYSLRFILSTDGGMTWSRPAIILNAENPLGPAALLQDNGGALHILLVKQEKDLTLGLEHWVWNNQDWSVVDGLSLGGSVTDRATNLSAALTRAGRLYAAFGTQTLDASGRLSPNALQFSSLVLKITPASRTAEVPSEPAVTPTPAQAGQLIPTVTLAPTLIPVDTTANSTGGLLASSWGGLALGAIFSSLLVVIGLAINRFSRSLHR